ncbi:hypothetical protein [Pseudanabaena sp. UWO310]|nr:hypothetical protein [Pseudanabaena sp. UWO310]
MIGTNTIAKIIWGWEQLTVIHQSILGGFRLKVLPDKNFDE